MKKNVNIIDYVFIIPRECYKIRGEILKKY